MLSINAVKSGRAAPSWAARYIGLPFDDNDADGAVHCWGLVRRVYANECGIMLPAYGELSALDMVAMAKTVRDETTLGGPWQSVTKGCEQEFDVAIMNGWGIINGKRCWVPNHVGIITPDISLLHVERATAAVCVPLRHSSVRFRYSACYRYATP